MVSEASSRCPLGKSRREAQQHRRYSLVNPSRSCTLLNNSSHRSKRAKQVTIFDQQLRCLVDSSPNQGNAMNFDNNVEPGEDWLDDGGSAPLNTVAGERTGEDDDDDVWNERMKRRKEFANRKGRGWEDTWEDHEILSLTYTYDDLPDWTPECVSPTSQERIQILPEKIPTVEHLARLPLPQHVHPHPGHGYPRAYAFHRDKLLAKNIAAKVRTLAEPKLVAIQSLSSIEEKQNAVDELFENVEFQLKETEEILGRHPKFGHWVEKGLEAYLVEVEESSRLVLYNEMLEIVEEKVKPLIKKIEESGSKEDAAGKLFSLMTDTTAAAGFITTPAKDHPLFSFWTRKAMDECLFRANSDAYKALTKEIQPLVRTALDSMSLSLDEVDAKTGKIPREKRNEIVQSIKGDIDGLDSPVLRNFHFMAWLKQSFKEYLYKDVATAVWDKFPNSYSDDITLQDQVDIVRIRLEQDEIPLMHHEDFRKWVTRAVGQLRHGKTEIEPIEPFMTIDELTSIPMYVISSVVQKICDEGKPEPLAPYPTETQDSDALPIFMDCYDPEDGEEKVPSILFPLEFRERQTIEGRMMEEWDLAARKDSKRIMLRSCMRAVAQVLDQCETRPARVLMHGRRGVGKTAAMAALVASARKSGHIVMYIPDANQLHKFGYYIEPSEAREGMWNLPILSQELLQRLLHVNEKDLKEFHADQDVLKMYFNESQLQQLPEGDGGRVDLVELAKFAAENTDLAAGCYDTVLHVMMNQEERPFDIFVDEFNIFYKHGEYFHMDYDEDVKESIPYPIINLFKPIMDAMALTIDADGEETLEPKLMKKGVIVAATSEMHPVPRKATDTLIANAKRSLKEHRNNLFVIEVPRLSKLEVEHMLSNYESIGLGKLRLDGGRTVNNPDEVEFLRVLSSSVPQNLMNACVDIV